MLHRLTFSTDHIICKVLLIGLTLFSLTTFVYAETFSVPQTTGVTLAWDANDPVPDGYHIYQRTEGQAYDYSQPVWTTTSTTATIYNLSYDTTYYYVVRAYVGTDASGDSNEVSFTGSSSSVEPPVEPSTYAITAAAAGDGIISPSGTVTVTQDTDQSFVISSSSGSYLVDVLVDGTSVGAVSSYTFTQVSGNHTISAEFAYYPHSISASSGSGGTISPSGEAAIDHGGSQSYLITPNTGYHVHDVVVDGISLGAITTYVFDSVIQDHTIHAAFALDQFSISSSAGLGGTITPSGDTLVTFGDSLTYTISANAGFTLADVTVDGLSVGKVDTYTFSEIGGDHTIAALFVAINQAPTADAGPNQTVDEGQIVTLSGLNSIDLDDGIASFQWRQVQGVDVSLDAPAEAQTTFTAPDVDDSGAALVFELTVTDYHGVTSVDSCIVNVTWINMSPIADAGVDQTVTEGSQVVLDASNSVDADDGIVSYAWKQLLGPVVVLSDTNSATPGFIAPDVVMGGASLTFEVTVTDSGGLKNTDTCVINISWVNVPPVADAGPDQDVAVGAQVQLDGSQSYDPDNLAIAAFKWRQIEGFPVELSDAMAQRPVFIVPAGADQSSPLAFELTVTDSGGLQATDICYVNVESSGKVLSISKILVILDKKGKNFQAHAQVTITDNVGTVVEQANVTGKWYLNGNVINTASAVTGSDGVAILDSDVIKVYPGEVFSVEIIGIEKEGYAYDLTSNTATASPISEPINDPKPRPSKDRTK